MNKKEISLYLHVPFCNGKCYYCKFFSVINDKSLVEKYFSSIKKEILNKKSLIKDYTVKSIYIGGGTPSCVDEKYIIDCLNVIKQNYVVNDNAEITIECNPNSIDKGKLEKYRHAGINRISIGVQSFNNSQLKLIGRLHNKNQAIDAIKLAKSVGFTNISVDILLGLPKESWRKIKNEIKLLKKLDIKHISAYMLILENNTLLYKLVENKSVKLPSDDNTVNIYNKMLKLLKKFNYERYEVSNFAKIENSNINYESMHNKIYWQCGEYIGFGVSAHSHIDNKRFFNAENFDEYYKNVESNTLPNNNIENITVNMKIEEIIMLGLRTKFGINIGLLNDLGYDIMAVKKREILNLLSNNIIKIENNYLKVTDEYFGVLNQIILKLI